MWKDRPVTVNWTLLLTKQPERNNWMAKRRGSDELNSREGSKMTSGSQSNHNSSLNSNFDGIDQVTFIFFPEFTFETKTKLLRGTPQGSTPLTVCFLPGCDGQRGRCAWLSKCTTDSTGWVRSNVLSSPLHTTCCPPLFIPPCRTRLISTHAPVFGCYMPMTAPLMLWSWILSPVATHSGLGELEGVFTPIPFRRSLAHLESCEQSDHVWRDCSLSFSVPLSFSVSLS